MTSQPSAFISRSAQEIAGLSKRCAKKMQKKATKTLNIERDMCEIPFFSGSEESRLFAESIMYVSRGFFTSVIKRVFVSLPLAIYIKFLTYSHFTHTTKQF